MLVLTLSDQLAVASCPQSHCVFPEEQQKSHVCGSRWCWHANTVRAAPGLVQATEAALVPTWRRKHKQLWSESYTKNYVLFLEAFLPSLDSVVVPLHRKYWERREEDDMQLKSGQLGVKRRFGFEICLYDPLALSILWITNILSAFPFRGHGSPVSIFCIFLCHTYRLHIHFQHIQKSPLWSSPFPPSWQLHLQHSSTIVFTIPPLHLIKPSQSSASYFISKTSNLGCSAEVLVLNPIHPWHSKRKIFLFCHL